ncbi:MAG: phosphoribosylformylglycinamidine synthase subunit PurL [archaeon]|nr:phosphoribosylformylglycinamidine synthase subunit PurL [archaeon]
MLHDIDILSATCVELGKISSEMRLGLSVDEMKKIVNYFRGEGRNPTDIELQSIGQAWSEHCCYKSSKSFLNEFIFTIDHPDVLSRGDAGVMAFDDNYGYALRIESHNHPSAIEPYGGAATGIGGILRDVVCMGAQPIGLVDSLCFGPINGGMEISSDVEHSKYILNGVVLGIRDYGNRVGVPTVSGGFFFDSGYTNNCLVNVACLGIVKKQDVISNHASGPGELMILLGGKTGRDGIHGVTFASSDLKLSSSEDSRGSVQLGDPITEEPTIHACIDVNQKKLITGMKDLGGGGLSCVIGEMALNAGCGVDVNLDKVPLKNDNLAPWEIWISESQERMMVTCKPENVNRILEIFDMWGISAVVIAKTTDTKRARVFWKEQKIFDMDLQFLTGGPIYNRPYVSPQISKKADEIYPAVKISNDTIKALISDLNVASKEWAIRQYDHEVRGSTVLHPLVGKINKTGPGDASVVMPVPGRYKGLAIAIGCNPWFTSENPYNGGMSCVDEACRNIVAVGAMPHSLTDCLNFGNPEKPERLGEFREAVKGIGDLCKSLRLPIPSGNVSFYNEALGGKCILPTPTILGCGLIEDIRKLISADIKEEGNKLFLIGMTKDEMGGSLFFRKFGGRGGNVPEVKAENLMSLTKKMLFAMDKKLIKSCHDCSDGGLAVAAAEMCISGDIGLNMHLSSMNSLTTSQKLFSESNTRWIIEVPEHNVSAIKRIFGCDATCIGITGGDRLTIKDADVDISVEEMRKVWNEPLWNSLGDRFE